MRIEAGQAQRARLGVEGGLAVKFRPLEARGAATEPGVEAGCRGPRRGLGATARTGVEARAGVSRTAGTPSLRHSLAAPGAAGVDARRSGAGHGLP